MTMDLSKGLHDRLEISLERGEMRDGAIRYLMMRPDVLMGMFAKLPQDVRRMALAALTESVAEFGGKSVAAYRNSGATSTTDLEQTIVRTSAELGWGVWNFCRQDDGSIEVTVRNSPFADGARGAEEESCAAITGMLTSLAPFFLGDGATVRETSCAARTGENLCRFHMRA